jgi:hypothetical protein
VIEPSLVTAAEASIARAVAYLTSAQLESGAFVSYVGGSMKLDGTCEEDPSIFPVALIAQALSCQPDATEICRRGASFLWKERQRFDVWSHWPRAHRLSSRLAPDVDDTAAASQVVTRHLGIRPRNLSLVLENRDERGLYYTWFAPRLPRSVAYAAIAARQLLHPAMLYFTFRYCAPRPSDVDAVVNANVLFHLGLRKETEPIVRWLETLLESGEECEADKFYDRPHVIWYFFSRALREARREGTDLFLQRLRAHPPVTTLEQILSVSTFIDSGQQPPSELITAILSGQHSDGSWRREGLYHGGRVSSADGRLRPRSVDVRWWGSEALTTAFAVEALSRMTATAAPA